jgi:hypothetical protein
MNANKLKFNKTPYILFLIFLLISIILIRLTPGTFFYLLLSILGIFPVLFLLRFIKTRNTYFLYIPIFIFSAISLTVLTGQGYLPRYVSAIILSGLYFVAIIIQYIERKKGVFFAARTLNKILELAAKPVNGIKDGFTNRPYPFGKLEYTKEEIIGFAKFLNKSLIATSIYKHDKIFLVLSWGFFQYIPGLAPDLLRVTYISFDFEGNMAVQIAKKDYNKYENQLTFDKLCIALGAVILSFLDEYKKSQKISILRSFDD